MALQTVDYANVTDSGSVQIAIQSSLGTAARKVGVKVKDFNNNASDSTTLENARLMVDTHPQAIIEFSPDVAVNPSLAAVFKAAHIPCISFDTPISGCTEVAIDNPSLGGAAGTVVGQMQAAKGWTGANTTVLALTDWSAGAIDNGEVTQFYQNFAKEIPGMIQKNWTSITSSTTKLGSNLLVSNCGLVPGPCETAVSEVLPTIPKSRHIVIVGLEEDSVLAGLTAAQSAGRGSDAYGIGSGGSVTTLRSNPQWLAEEGLFYPDFGEYYVAIADALISKVVLPAVIDLPFAILTKSNQGQYYGTSSTNPTELPSVPSAYQTLEKLGVLQKFGNITGLS